MRLQAVFLTYLLITFCAVAAVTSPYAATSTSSIQVSVTIKPWIKFKADQKDGFYHVKRADLERGYVDIPSNAVITLKTNERKPIIIAAETDGPERILIREAGIGSFDQNGGTVSVKSPKPGEEVVKLIDFRIILPKSAKEGTYPLNVALMPKAY